MTKTAHYPWPWPSRSSIVIGILLVGLTIFCAARLLSHLNSNLKGHTADECTAVLFAFDRQGPRSRRIERRTLTQSGQTQRSHKGKRIYLLHLLCSALFVAGVQTQSSWLTCYAQPNEDSSMYYVTFDADKRIESVVYYMPAGADSQQVKVPGTDGLMLPATLYSRTRMQ